MNASERFLFATFSGVVALFGLNQTTYFGFDSIGAVWLTAVLLAISLYLPVRWFANLKARRRDITWLKYF